MNVLKLLKGLFVFIIVILGVFCLFVLFFLCLIFGGKVVLFFLLISSSVISQSVNINDKTICRNIPAEGRVEWCILYHISDDIQL